MGLVQEKECKELLWQMQSTSDWSLPVILSSLPSPECFRKPRSSRRSSPSAAPARFRTPSPSEPRAQNCRAEPSATELSLLTDFSGSVGRPPLAAPETSPAPVAGATPAQVGHCRLQSSEVLKMSPRWGECGAACIYRPAELLGRCNMHLLQSGLRPRPRHPFGLHKLQRSPRPNYP